MVVRGGCGHSSAVLQSATHKRGLVYARPRAAVDCATWPVLAQEGEGAVSVLNGVALRRVVLCHRFSYSDPTGHSAVNGMPNVSL